MDDSRLPEATPCPELDPEDLDYGTAALISSPSPVQG
jgi:hypothetical protein